MGERGCCGACPSLAGYMRDLGIVLGFCVFVLEGSLILRGRGRKTLRLFPFFYSYLIFCFLWIVGMYAIHWLKPQAYPYAYWICYLVSILVEFMVLVEISDQIFRPFPVIRNLGRALTALISLGFGSFYILPTIFASTGRSHAISGFVLRTFVTKAIILAVLFYVSKQYGCELGRNVGGIMLGFSIYVAVNVAMMGSIEAFGSALFARVIWFIEPLAFMLCLLVWTISLWEPAPIPNAQPISRPFESSSRSIDMDLIRLNTELSKILHK